ncbi:MAG: PQQ-binding-like beta-propeller repeat protein [Planctomycetaceae bacterium]|nr:PQQ-binding-like beta-propeller repeat protein [Planctomycetaceae bacterium]
MRAYRYVLAAVLMAVPVLVLAADPAAAADWPTFRKDIARSGVTDESLSLPLTQAWVFVPPFQPHPAFGPGYPLHTNWEGGVEKRRIDFDRADSTVAVGDSIYFGSVGDGKVYCLDAATAKVKWAYPTGGPVRLAPTVDAGNVYVGSDDGWIYCLSAADGKEVWKFRAAPEDRRVIGLGKMVSLWPVRSSVMVDSGIAYFTAGIFPSEGVFLYAVDAKTGKLIWKNDSTGEQRLLQVCPQGYLLANKNQLVVPNSRLCPFIYDRATGKGPLLRLSIYYGGGTFAALDDAWLYTGWEGARAFRINTTNLKSEGGNTECAGSFPGGQLVADSGRVYSCGLPHGEGVSKAVKAIRFTPPPSDGPPVNEKEARRGKGGAAAAPAENGKELWSAAMEAPECIILAGKTLFVGAPGKVAALDADSGKETWTAKVDGSALSLTVANGRLIVSTDTGKIYCFAGGAAAGGEVRPAADPNVKISDTMQAAADAALKLAPEIRKGFALVYGVETGEMALEIARKSDLMVVAVSDDAAKVAAAQKLIDSAGLYGGRVIVQQWPLDRVPYTKYFAALVVSETAVLTGKCPGTWKELYRMTQPVRGTVVLPQAAKDFVPADELAQAKTDAGSIVCIRPPLKDARPWTHQYAVPGNTASSMDKEVRAPFRVQWFGDPGPADFVDRHYWGASPLALDGRMFVCSYSSVTAYDAYTGVELWSFPLKNATRAHIADVPSNVAVGPEGYFIAVDDTCRRLDPATGKLLGEYKVPPSADGKAKMWGYVALVDGVLVGSRTLGKLDMAKWPKSRGEEVAYWLCSDLLFAMDAKTGKILWQHQSPWFSHNSVVAGTAGDTGGKAMVYCLDPNVPDGQVAAAVAESKPFTDKFPGGGKQVDKKGKPVNATVQLLLGFDLREGLKWQKPADCSFTGGHRVTLVLTKGLLLQMSDQGGWKAFTGYNVNEGAGRGMSVRKAATGDLVWLKDLSYRSRAVIAGDTIFAEPWAYNLATGEKKTIPNPLTGQTVPWRFVRPYKHCGPFNASAETLFFRCEGFGYYDTTRDTGVSLFPSNRPNCWMSFIAAEGMALWPAGDTGCRCGLPISCSVALVHDDEDRVYGDYSFSGDLTPVRTLALNIAGPGDRRDAGGQLWLAFPRNKYGGSVELPYKTAFDGDEKYDRRNSIWNGVKDAPAPWVYASAAVGIKQLTLPLRKAADGPGKYTVTLHFAAWPGDAAGKRVFDIKLQGNSVKEGVDPAAAGPDRPLVLTFENIDVKDDLTIDLTAKGSEKPLLCGIEVKLAQ